MFSILLLGIAPMVLYAILVLFRAAQGRVLHLLMASYAVRVAGYIASQNVALFNDTVGGDCWQYQRIAGIVVSVWLRTGVHFIGVDEVPAVSQAALPVNIFALITYLNGGPASEGCAAFIILCACLTGYAVHRLCTELGASEDAAYWTTAIFMFLPGYVLYTSDSYKDGVVALLTVTAIGNAIALSRKFSLVSLAVAVITAWALWYVRFYLVYATLLPLVVGFMGFNSKSIARPLISSALVIAVTTFIVLKTQIGDLVTDSAQATFDLATSSRVMNVGKDQGSGVVFDDGGQVYGALLVKVLYTLFSPFPWQSGSTGFHVGKIDSSVTVFFFYRAIVAGKRLWKTDRGLVVAFLSFIAPMTFIYAMGMNNIGLTLRQRIPIVVMIMVLGALSWPKKIPTDQASASVPDPKPELVSRKRFRRLSSTANMTPRATGGAS